MFNLPQKFLSKTFKAKQKCMEKIVKFAMKIGIIMKDWEYIMKSPYFGSLIKVYFFCQIQKKILFILPLFLDLFCFECNVVYELTQELH